MLFFWLCIEENENGTACCINQRKKKGKEKGEKFVFESWSEKVRRIGEWWSCGTLKSIEKREKKEKSDF